MVANSSLVQLRTSSRGAWARCWGAIDDSAAALAPGLLLFGSNGGDAAYAFDRRQPAASRIVKIPYVDLGQESAPRLRSDSFLDFLDTLAREEQGFSAGRRHTG